MTKIYGGEDAERGVGGWTRFEKALIPCKLNHNTIGEDNGVGRNHREEEVSRRSMQEKTDWKEVVAEYQAPDLRRLHWCW
jgi:hypothetical protein